LSSLKRRHFLALAASAPALASCGGSSGSGVNIGQPPPIPGNLPALGQQYADLRYKFVTLPAASAGYNPAGDAAALVGPGVVSPATSPVPGQQTIGSYAQFEQYVIRVPTNWNGKLMVAGTPATRSCFASDGIWGDLALALGYAYASSNKGIMQNAIAGQLKNFPANLNQTFPIPYNLLNLETLGFGYQLGALLQGNSPTPDKWNNDFAQIIQAAKKFLAVYYGKAPTRTYVVGLSNGGALVRSALEQHGDLVDGGVDWSGVFWSPGLNILSYMPQFLAGMPAYTSSGFTSASAAAQIEAAGYPADITQAGNAAHPSLWFEYLANQTSFYTDLTVFEYGLLIDPQATSSLTLNGCTPDPANPTGLPGNCDATGLASPQFRQTYAPSSAATTAIANWSHTGNIAKPLVSICGSADMFVTAPNNATPYLNAVNAAGKGSQYWQYVVQGGTHVDTFVAFGYGLQTQVQFAWAAFEQLVAIVENGFTPSGAGTAQPVSAPSQIRSS